MTERKKANRHQSSAKHTAAVIPCRCRQDKMMLAAGGWQRNDHKNIWKQWRAGFRQIKNRRAGVALNDRQGRTD